MATAKLTAAFGRLSVCQLPARQHLKAQPSSVLRAARLSAQQSTFTASVALTTSTAVQATRLQAATIECAQGHQRGGKLKTRKAAAKRYKVTGSGKVVTRKPGKQHLNQKMRPKQLRRLSGENVVPKVDLPKIIPNLPYAKINK